MPWHINQAYRVAGREAQHAFWGQGNVVPQSLLHQFALRIAAKSAARERSARSSSARANGLDRRHPPRRSGRGGHGPRGAASTGWRRAHRGADPPGFPARPCSPPSTRRAPRAGVRPDAAGGTRPGMGAPGRVHGPSAAGRPRGRVHRSLDATAASLDRRHPGDGSRWADFVAPYVEAFDAVRATMLERVAAARWPVALLRRAGPVRTRLVRGAACHPRASARRRLFRGVRSAGVALRGCRARRHPDAVPAAPRWPPSTSTCSVMARLAESPGGAQTG